MKKIITWIFIVFVAIQFVPVDKTNKAVNKKTDFVEIYRTPQSVRTLLRNACYDCHSNEVIYPWYSKVAPISWLIKDHVNQGKDHLNFSEWGFYNKDLKNNAIEKSIETIKNYKMPLPSYIGYHPLSNLTSVERTSLADYFKSLE